MHYLILLPIVGFIGIIAVTLVMGWHGRTVKLK